MTTARVIVVWGGAGGGKTWFTGSGKGQKWYAEFDRGSFDRANFSDPSRFEVHKYYPPLETLLDFGKILVGEKGGIAPTNSRLLVGMSELIEQFRDDYLLALRNPEFSDMIIDGSNFLFEHVASGFQQEMQEATGNERERLTQLRFTEPNRRMRAFIQAPGMMGKNLFLIEHEKEVWINDKPSGTFRNDGFKEVPNMADLTLRFFLVNKQPVARIVKAGTGGLTLIDMELVAPTFETVDGLLVAAGKLRAMSLPVPNEYGALMAKAKSLD